MERGEFPLKILGCPITRSKKKKEDFAEVTDKTKGKLQAWKGRLLSYGGKEVLLKNVLQSVPIYVLSTLVPPKSVESLQNSSGTTKNWVEVDTGQHGSIIMLDKRRGSTD